MFLKIPYLRNLKFLHRVNDFYYNIIEYFFFNNYIIYTICIYFFI